MIIMHAEEFLTICGDFYFHLARLHLSCLVLMHKQSNCKYNLMINFSWVWVHHVTVGEYAMFSLIYFYGLFNLMVTSHTANELQLARCYRRKIFCMHLKLHLILFLLCTYKYNLKNSAKEHEKEFDLRKYDKL